MKVNGVSTDKSKAIFGPLTFKRGDQFLAFYAQPVWTLDEFEALCPPPVNEYYRFTKNGKEKDPDAPAYRDMISIYSRKRWGYVVLKSLEPSKIEWDKVSLDDPNTWKDVEQELRAELGLYEFAKVMTLVDEANAIDAAKLEENAQSFFQLMSAEDTSKSSQPVEAESSSSSALASDSE